MLKYVNPVSDIFVRYLLGSEENTPVLKDFINTILEDSDTRLAEKITILTPFCLSDIAEGKESILDVKAVDSHNRTFNVEIQVFPDRDYEKRTLFYWSRLYSEQLGEGEDYGKLHPVICINLLNFIFFDQFVSAHSCFLPLEKNHTNIVLSDQMQINFFELPKMDVPELKTLSSGLERWAYYFRWEGKLDDKKLEEVLLKEDPVMKQAHDAYKKFTADNEYLEVYEARMKADRDRLNSNRTAREDGFDEGHLEGLAEGALKTKHETALKMLKKGFDIADIVELTGLSEEEIHSID